jgi:cation transport regulator ChaB
MSMTAEQIYRESLQLPDESKAFLAERLVEYLESHIDNDLERIHLDTAKRRRDEVRSGQAHTVDGDEALARVRRLVKE